MSMSIIASALEDLKTKRGTGRARVLCSKPQPPNTANMWSSELVIPRGLKSFLLVACLVIKPWTNIFTLCNDQNESQHSTKRRCLVDMIIENFWKWCIILYDLNVVNAASSLSFPQSPIFPPSVFLFGHMCELRS